MRRKPLHFYNTKDFKLLIIMSLRRQGGSNPDLLDVIERNLIAPSPGEVLLAGPCHARHEKEWSEDRACHERTYRER
jgi:hypothetical protein